MCFFLETWKGGKSLRKSSYKVGIKKLSLYSRGPITPLISGWNNSSYPMYFRPFITWQLLGKTLLKVKLLVGPTCKIPRSTQRSCSGIRRSPIRCVKIRLLTFSLSFFRFRYEPIIGSHLWASRRLNRHHGLTRKALELLTSKRHFI